LIKADASQTFFACAYLGAALVLLNYAYTEHEMVELLKIICKCRPYHFMTTKLTLDIAPKMLVAPAGFIYYDYTKIFPKLEEKVKTIEKYIVLEDLNGIYKMSIDKPNYVAYENYLQQYKPNASALPKVDISPHDMVNVQFTSGSTGLPKNVALSHYNIMVPLLERPMR
jgi:mevalonyl-CoA ligase